MSPPAFSKREQSGRERPGPVARGGLRARSPKMEDAMDEYVPLRKRYLETHKVCEIKIRGVCTKFARDVHHRAGRTGKALTDESTFAACCRSCHTWVEEHRDAARERGWIVRREVRK